MKETEIGHIVPGQKVDIEVDAYPGRTFHGEVSSIAAATGTRFSLLPPDNAHRQLREGGAARAREDPVVDLPDGVVMRAGRSAEVVIHVGRGFTLAGMKPTSLLPALLLVCAACGGSSTPPDAHTTPIDAHVDAAPVDAPAGTVQLTVKNYQAWCSVTVGNNAAFTDPSRTFNVQPGVIHVSAVARPGFELGTAPWHNTDGDTGSGELGTVGGSGSSASSATTETVGNVADCIWVCCQVVGANDCPTTNQCP